MREAARFAEQVRRLQGPLLALARRAARDPADAEDILQGALAAAFRARASYDPARPFRAWLAGYVVNVARNVNRRSRPRSLPALEELPLPDQLAREWSYERLLEDPEAALQRVGAELFRAVRDLGDSEREVFLLRALLELSYRDIAAVCRIPMGTVMSRLHRARAALRAALAREENPA